MISPSPRGVVEDSANLAPPPAINVEARPSISVSYIDKDLATCSHVYLRVDRVRQPLEPSYDGPIRVVSRGTKTFRIQR
ncbi:unnamed protein product [Schistocephalus solidus]|uniref:Uncharacterized protein n=1 Tax=Schistocephalus solidus TaxID=70667 RepID=A0A183T301_SCHSO|nr:unnamed protein product [Schistocephalus solidus]